MLPSCKQVAEQLSENMEQPITGLSWFKLKLHLIMCQVCRLYGKQIELSAKTVNLLDSKETPSQALKQEILQHYRDCHGKKQDRL